MTTYLQETTAVAVLLPTQHRPGFNLQSAQFPGWGLFWGFPLTITNVRKFRQHSSLGIIYIIQTIFIHLCMATVSDLSCSTWQSLNNKLQLYKMHPKTWKQILCYPIIINSFHGPSKCSITSLIQTPEIRNFG